MDSKESSPIEDRIEHLKNSRESLLQAHEAFYYDSKQFQHETLKALTQFASEIQNLKDRLTEVVKVVHGTDNPDALHLRSQIFKRDLAYLEGEIEELKKQVEAHARFHSEDFSNRSDRSWQVRLAVITMILGLLGAAIAGLTPLVQKAITPIPAADENPWFKD